MNLILPLGDPEWLFPKTKAVLVNLPPKLSWRVEQYAKRYRCAETVIFNLAVGEAFSPRNPLRWRLQLMLWQKGGELTRGEILAVCLRMFFRRRARWG